MNRFPGEQRGLPAALKGAVIVDKLEIGWFGYDTSIAERNIAIGG
jgi:hypothetical protein